MIDIKADSRRQGAFPEASAPAMCIPTLVHLPRHHYQMPVPSSLVDAPCASSQDQVPFHAVPVLGRGSVLRNEGIYHLDLSVLVVSLLSVSAQVSCSSLALTFRLSDSCLQSSTSVSTNLSLFEILFSKLCSVSQSALVFIRAHHECRSSTGTCQKIPAGFIPADLNQIIPMDHGGSGY